MARAKLVAERLPEKFIGAEHLSYTPYETMRPRQFQARNDKLAKKDKRNDFKYPASILRPRFHQFRLDPRLHARPVVTR
jgi:hypothetical protein